MKALKFLLLLIFCFNIKSTAFAEESTVEIDSIIKNVAYDYELSYVADNMINCNGTLKLTVNIPSDASHVILALNNPLSVMPSFFSRKIELLIDDRNIVTEERKDIRWDTLFYLYVIYKDGRKEETSIFNVNSYIDEEDLNLLLDQAYIEDVNEDDVKVLLNNRLLSVDTQKEINLNVFDFLGRFIFSNVISQPINIPINSPFIIVQYRIKDKVFTKKLMTK